MSVRPLETSELDNADRIFRLAFGTWLQLPDPLQFAGDSSWVRTRFLGNLGGAHAVDVDRRLAGTNFTANRGSLGFFGPLTIDPALWGRGLGQLLVAAAVRDFEAWHVAHAGLFTFAESALHVGLYRRFGFWPGALTAILKKTIASAPSSGPAFETYSSRRDGHDAFDRQSDLIGSAALEGLTVVPEIHSVFDQRLGETIFVGDEGFAVCHLGAGSEAGSATCRVKFAAARSAPAFEALASAWEAWAASHGAGELSAGVNYAREGAIGILFNRDYRAIRQGVAMYRGRSRAYDRPDAWVVDDWR